MTLSTCGAVTPWSCRISRRLRSSASADGKLSGTAVALDEAGATTLAGELADADFAIRSVERKPYTRKPYAPFRTSTLQQEAGRKLRFTAQRTMRVAAITSVRNQSG